MTIEIKLNAVNKDGKTYVKKYTRPDTNVLELEKFQDMQDEIEKSYPDIDAKDPKFSEKFKAVDWGKIRRQNQNRNIEFIVDLFKDHDGFTIEEFKFGVPSKNLETVVKGVFEQIAPWDFKKPAETEKKSDSQNGKKA